jgi:cytochrome c peroxidase
MVSATRRPVCLLLVALTCIALFSWACAATPAEQHTSPARVPTSEALDEPIKPIPRTIDLDPGKVALGRQLFHEPQLSHDNSIACSSCHDLAHGGVDHLPRSVGIGGQVGTHNAPTVFNAGFNFVQFWDGRARSLEDQIDGPTQAPAEMGSTWPEIVEKLEREAEYQTAFASVYQSRIDRDRVKDAIATFERSLLTPDSRFDRFLRGDSAAITPNEREGYRLFKTYGCASCHQGVGVGGNLFQRLGVIEDFLAARGSVTPADLGRFNVTHDELDRYVFKVPSLRNVANTAPYFHDGSLPTLEAAVAAMGRFQLGRPLSSTEVGLITEFLGTLSGEYAAGGSK